MSRSRAVNRTNRFTAKKRRRALRSAVPNLSQETQVMAAPPDHLEDLKDKALDQETLLELLEPQQK